MITTEKKSVKAGSYVSTKHVDTLIRTYKQERWADNSQKIGKADSLTVWHSLEELEVFLQTARQHAADGVKFCFGVYPENYEEQPEYAGRQTIVMVATKSKEEPNGLTQKDIYVQGKDNTKILAFNKGRICPPYCPHDVDNPDVGITIIDGAEGMIVI